MSKTTIGFNIHPTKTLRYLIKEGKTLVFKSRVNFDTGIGLDTYPMSTGEILEKVCKMYADGFTEGNKSIKAISNNVTYNTNAVTKGALYCISYRDGGFYVGFRTTEDYEPKEGDWWCYFTVTKTIKYNTDSSGGGYVDFLRGEEVGLFLDTTYNPNEYKWYFTFLKDGVIVNTYNLVGNSEFYFLTVDINNSYQLVNANSYQGKLLKYPLPSAQILNNKSIIGYTNNSTTYNNKGTVFRKLGTPNVTEKVSILLWKPITTSDILSYQNTGKMGGIILGEELEVISNTVTSSKQILYDSNTQIAVFVFDENGNMINLNMASVSGSIGIKCSIYKLNSDDSSKNSIFNIYAMNQYNYMYIYQYDYASYFENDIKHKLTFERTNGGIEYSYTIRAFKVLQNNMATPSLLSNNLNSNSNDETDG